MNIRTSKRTVTFRQPFYLDQPDRLLPAGNYMVETDEELVEGLSFSVYRRIATHIYVHPKPGVTQMLVVSPAELAAAEARDAAAAEESASPNDSGG